MWSSVGRDVLQAFRCNALSRHARKSSAMASKDFLPTEGGNAKITSLSMVKFPRVKF